MPSGGPRLCVLHISDLHFCATEARGHYWNTEATELAVAPHNRRGLLGSLLYDLRNEGLAPDLVVVSGDLLDRGNETGIEPVVVFLKALAEGLGLPVSRLVIAPGNHDVLRGGDPAGRYVLYDRIRGALYGDTRPAFAEGTPPHQRVDHHVFEDLDVEVVAFNSCEELEASAQKEHGSVGVGQRDHADGLLRRTRTKGHFRIAVVHHHLESPAGVGRTDYSVMTDAGGMRRWLARERFQLALHGHQHVDWHDVRELDGWFLAIAAAASAGVAEYGRKEWALPIAYQILVVEGPTRGRRIRREYDPQTMEWADAGRGEDTQALRFGPADAAVSSGPAREAKVPPPPEEAAPPSLTRKGRIAVKIQHLERAIDSHRSTLRVQLVSLGAAVFLAVALAAYLYRMLPPVLSVSGGFALLFAGSIGLPMRLASYRESIDRLHFLKDGYQRCASHRDDELVQVLDERFQRLI
ncbi:metallophosphoesterase family protein [Polyangium mundeleinium]|uniref:Metallophosphoesterase n=1 Tax=Polyangium mundeleinium TaxID=2995306 RepID=A0ABT5F391_9BACT|nr:metallophosphoesterase [Polyangium mundeleinium]MDC0748089.1 metallophosphoesterase [Polyangium mundeleinium]